MYSKIDDAIWRDDKIPLSSDDGKLLFFYMLTTLHRNILGMYVLPVPYIAYDLRWKESRVTAGIDELIKLELIRVHSRESIVLLPNFLRYNPLDNPNQVKAALNSLKTVPRSDLDMELYARLQQTDKPVLIPLLDALHERMNKIKSEPVTKEKPHVPKTALDVSAVEQCYEGLTNLYPNKLGKNTVKALTKKALFDKQVDVEKSIAQYKIHLEQNPWKKAMNASTFFNGRWTDFLADESEKEDKLVLYNTM